MARILKKIPNFKLPKYKMRDIEEIEELKVEYTPEDLEELKKRNSGEKSKDGYPGTEYKTVKEFFDKSTKEFADRPFILEKFNRKGNFEEITYGKFREDVINLGTGLVRGFKLKGEKILIIGETTYHWYVSYMAILGGVGIAVPTDKELPDNELENIVKRSDAAAIIFSPRKKDQIKKIANRCPGVKYFMEMYSDEKIDGRFVGLEHVMNEGKFLVDMGCTDYTDIEIEPDAFAVLIFTSGTTSAAKGVMISNTNLAYNINSVTPYVYLTPEDRLFSVLPLHHTYESTIGFLYPMAMGASVAVCQGLKHIANDMKETSPTAIIAVPLLIESLHKKIVQGIEKSGKTTAVKTMISLSNGLKNLGIDVKRKVFKDIYANLGGRLRIIVSAAAPIDGKVGRWLEDIGITFLQGYGLTETAPIAALTPDWDTRVGSAGKSVVWDQIKISEPNEKGEGEIWIKGKTVMLGYYEDPEATAEVMNDGWFNSGDIGYMDEDGFIYITGRSKNVIVTQNGKNIYPEEIETLLSKVEEISESMVYGKEVAGEKELIITARIIPDYDRIEELHGKGLNEEEIYKLIWEQIKKVNRKLSNYKTVKKLEIKEDQFEKTSTMKIKRYAELAKDKECEKEN
ncbi:MAG: long-chain fatty acid--CoA ligase [Firmicutes bacterium]|jgi:long-chain acyl-CoA synthetase|nr:long-chain fatty acid--CoA ligase [Bacillota bacterium]